MPGEVSDEFVAGFLNRPQAGAQPPVSQTGVSDEFVSGFLTRGSQVSPGIPSRDPADQPDPPPSLIKVPIEESHGKIFSGGPVRDVFDALSSMQYAAAGAALGLVKGENPLSSAWKGVENRASWEDVLAHAGMEEGTFRSIVGIAGDILLDPSWLITPAKGFNMLSKLDAFKAATKAIQETAEASKVGRFIGRNFVYGYKAPELLKGFEHDMAGTLDKFSGEIIGNLKEYGALAKEDKSYSQFLTGYLENRDPLIRAKVLEEAKNAGLDADKIAELGEKSQDLDTRIVKEMFANKVIGKKKLEEALGTPRYKAYRGLEDVQQQIKVLDAAGDPISRAAAADLNAWVVKSSDKFVKKAANKTPEEVEALLKASMGDISDVGYQMSKYALVGANSAVEARFLNQTLSQYGQKAMALTTDVRIPSNARYGRLQGVWVPQEISDFVVQRIHDAGWWERKISTPLTWWKMGKVVANPAAQARNMLANLGLINMSGVPTARLPDLYVKAWKLLHHEGAQVFERPELQEQAVKLVQEVTGSFESSFVKQELDRSMRFINVSGTSFFSKAKNIAQMSLDKASDFYRHNEVWGKLAAGLHGVENGMDAEKAALFGEKALFNYAQVPKAIDMLRRNGVVPFASFAYFATNATARAAWSNPAVLSKYAKIAEGIERMNPDAQKERQAAADWQQEYGHVFTPLKDKYGRHLVFDASYMLPFGDMAQAAESGVAAKLMGLTPGLTFASDVMRNRSAFTGQPITPAFDLRGGSLAMKEVAVKNYVDYIYKFAMPSWMPSILPGFPHRVQVTSGGYAFKSLEDAATARPDVFGEVNGKPVQDWKAAVMGEVFGLKTRPFDLQGEQQYRAYEYKDAVRTVTKQMSKVAMDQTLSVEQKRSLMAQLNKDLVNVHRAWRTTP